MTDREGAVRSELRVVVYDGYCHLCSGWVRFFKRHRLDPPFELLPMQDARGRALLIQRGIDPDDPSTFLVLDQSAAYTASDAALHLVRSVGGAWRLLHAARLMPRAWRDALYRLVAQNRYRWFGRRATCYLPTDSP